MTGVAIPLILGLTLGNPTAGVIAASGALALGVGSFQKNKQSHPLAILLGGFVMGLSTLVGTLAGHWVAAAVALLGLWGFAGGLLFELNLAVSFVGIKAVLAILIAGGYPSDGGHAALRALLVLSGGMIQALLAVVEGPLRKRWGGTPRVSGETPSFSKTYPAFISQLHPRSFIFQTALRLGVALVLSDSLARALSLQRSYWLPMTVLIVLRPEFQQTFSRGLARMAGTVAGVGLATLLTLAVRPNSVELAGLVLVFAGLCFAFFSVNYAAFALCVTAYAVFMVTLAGMPEETAALDRLIGNLLGGTFAMLVFVLWPIRNDGGEKTAELHDG